MDTIGSKVAKNLLEIKAIQLQPATPFTWASGWKSPIYCDNRKTLSYPQSRALIRDAFVQAIKQTYPDAEVIAGVATGAIAQAALVAEAMNLPMVYVRSSAKKHGMTNQIEGVLPEDAKVVVIEDLISTGGSSLAAVEALRNAGSNVLGMLAIFSYGFDVAVQNFKDNNCQLHTLSNYQTLIKEAVESKYIGNEEVYMLTAWRKNPAEWGK